MQKKLGSLWIAIAYCLRLSWDSSAFFTVFRFLCNLCVPVFSLIATYQAKYILDLLAGPGDYAQPEFTLFFFLGILLLVKLLQSISNRINQYCQTIQDELLSRQINLTLMEKAASLDLEFYDRAEYYDKLVACMRDSSAINQMLWNTVSCVSALVSCLAAFLALAHENVLYGIGMLAAAVPASLAAVRYTKLVYQLSLEQINDERKKSYISSILTLRQYAQDIRLFDAGNFLMKRYRSVWSQVFTKRRDMIRARSQMVAVLECIPELVIIGVTISIALRILDGKATVGDYSLYTGLLAQLWSGIFLFTNGITGIYDNQLKIMNFCSLQTLQNRIRDEGTEKLKQVRDIEFDHVSFTYPGTTSPVLRNISFRIGDGEKVALVGINGSGKSTLIKLLLRFYDVDSGAIRINGRDIREYPIKELRRQFSVYFQNMPNYSFTLRDNLLIAEGEEYDECRGENALDEHIRLAFRESGGEDILAKAGADLGRYLTLYFDDNGMELSGGQHQKVALARTFFRQHSALILDEPSSSLDPEAEHQFFKRLEQMVRGKTTIFTSHRLANVSLADRIVVIEEGKVIEDGTQEELLRNPKRYAQLYRYQQETYRGH